MPSTAPAGGRFSPPSDVRPPSVSMSESHLQFECLMVMWIFALIFRDSRMDEQLAFRPFEDLNVLLSRPAHLATFVHYLFLNCFVEEEMVGYTSMLCVCIVILFQVFYLATEWYKSAPTREQAQKIFDDFISTSSVPSILSNYYIKDHILIRFNSP
jgi:hypothetical protein